MPSNLLTLVPLLAGYLFYRIFYFTRFKAQSLDGYRLIFQSSIVGLSFFALSRSIVGGIKGTLVGQSAGRWWAVYASHTEYSGTAVGTVLLAVTVAAVLNIPNWELWRRAYKRKRLWAAFRRRAHRYFNPLKKSTWMWVYTHVALWDSDVWVELNYGWDVKRKIALNWATRQQKNQLLLLLSEASLRNRMISVSLKNRKYYMGYVKSAPSLDPSETYFRVYPVASGYRDKDTLRFEKTTDYQTIADSKSTEPLFVTLPIADVETANFFDPTIYAEYFSRVVPKKHFCGLPVGDASSAGNSSST